MFKYGKVVSSWLKGCDGEYSQVPVGVTGGIFDQDN